MERKKLYMIREEGGGPEWLSDDKAAGIGGGCREATDADLTLEAMADHLDQDAEDINAHDFVCCHRGLAALLHREVGREVATRIMRRLVDFDGLHGMTGVCGAGDPAQAAKTLGVPLDSWGGWKLP